MKNVLSRLMMVILFVPIVVLQAISMILILPVLLILFILTGKSLSVEAIFWGFELLSKWTEDHI